MKTINWAMMLGTAFVLAACGGDKPQLEEASFETMTVKKQDLNIPVKFSARLKGKTDVTVSPQVSGQLTQICVKEGQGTISSFDRAKVSKTYNLQMNLSWDLDLFGSITNKKRAAKAVLMQAQMSEEATRSNLISSVAQEYFYLLLLDRQLDILTQTDSLWAASLEMEKALFDNGQGYSTAVNQLESSWLDVKTAQLTEQKLQKEYVQTVIDAGKEVNKAMAQCQAAREKHGYYQRQVQVLHEAYVDTHYLMESGDANYLEVLTAQESFLSAQLSEAENLYDGAQAVIALYIALGGGTK